MLYLKLFQTEQEKQACTETQEYVSYTVENDEINIMNLPFFCKLTLYNGEVVEIEGSGELTSAMTNQYSATTVSAEIGELCTSIGLNAFSHCNGLTSVTIGNSVTSISNSAFYYCSGLTSVTIGSGVTSIGLNVFHHCSKLTSITSLATTAPTIYFNTFQNVKSNGTLTVPSGSSGYDVWMGTGDYYLGKYNWAKVEQ